MGRRKADVEELKERMKRFGPTVIRLAEKMPGSRAATVVSNQMVRAGTSAGANYRSACRARSRADFIAKMGIVEEELDETLYWLEVSIEAGFLAVPALASYPIQTKDLVRTHSVFEIVLSYRRTLVRPSVRGSFRIPNFALRIGPLPSYVRTFVRS
jgi:four helix bundle protein